jgi:hypothetical protein
MLHVTSPATRRKNMEKPRPSEELRVSFRLAKWFLEKITMRNHHEQLA